MNKKRQPKLLITGIESFTGRYLKEYFLLKGFDVYGLSLDKEEINEKIFQCDILHFERVKQIIQKISPDYIIHLAAISTASSKAIQQIYSVNILGAINVLGTCLTLKYKPEKIIISSTASVYGNMGDRELHEDICPRPISHYGNSKLAMENMARNYFTKLSIMIVRPFNYTGPGQSTDFVIPKIVDYFKRKELEIELGNINVAREFNDIRYITELYYKILMSKYSNDIVNFCSGRSISIKSLIETLSKITGHELKIKINNGLIRDNEISSLRGSTDKLSSMIGELPAVISIDDTLKYMIENN